jgi:DNA-binding response OmpR family regulator
MDETKKPDSPAGTPTIMIVEPDIHVRVVVADYLRDCGYKVIEGKKAEDVHKMLAAGEAIDIVITEIELPGDVDGFTLARDVRQLRPSIDIILSSGAAKTADKAGSLCDEGPLEKPYHPEDLLRRIKILRGQRKAEGK